MSPCCTSCGHTRETTRLINYIAKLQCAAGYIRRSHQVCVLCVCRVTRLIFSVPFFSLTLLNVSRDALCDLPRVMKQLNMFDIFSTNWLYSTSGCSKKSLIWLLSGCLENNAARNDHYRKRVICFKRAFMWWFMQKANDDLFKRAVAGNPKLFTHPKSQHLT